MMTSRIKLLYRCELQAPIQKVWLWHLRRYCIDNLTPPNPRIFIEKRPANLNKGSRLVLRLRFFYSFALSLIFEHSSSIPFRQFTDTMIKGPLHLWKHEHRFLPWKETATVIEDHLEIEYSRFGWLNRYLHPFLEKNLDRIFRWRHHITAFNLQLWQEWPFADQVFVFGLSHKTSWLTQRLRAALEPIPVHEHDPHKLISHHGLTATVLNAIGYTKPVLASGILEQLRKHPSKVLICFYDQKNPAWLKALEAYADQIMWIEVAGLVNPYKRILLPSQQEKWCSEEDLLSLVFQVLHERKGYGMWHYCRREPLKNSFRTYLSESIARLKKSKPLSPFKKGLLKTLEGLDSFAHYHSKHPKFNLKITPWKSFKHWKEISYRV